MDIETECAHCREPLHLTVDSELRWQVRSPGAEPLVFHPQVDWPTFTDPNIIHGF